MTLLKRPKRQPSASLCRPQPLLPESVPEKAPQAFLDFTRGLPAIPQVVEVESDGSSSYLEPPWQGSEPGVLQLVEISNFKAFAWHRVSFEDSQAVCLTGVNASGKTSVIDALNFALLVPGGKPLGTLVRRDPRRQWQQHKVGTVTAHFGCGACRRIVLQRRLRHKAETDTVETTFLVSTGGELVEVDEECYRLWLVKALCWGPEDVLYLPQYSLLSLYQAASLLQQLPLRLPKGTGSAGESLDDQAPDPTRVKRRRMTRLSSAESAGDSDAASSACSGSRSCGKTQEWLRHRVDAIFQDLTREPLDESMSSWGDGGECVLQQAADGTFSLHASERRGVASAGLGTAVANLADGRRDLCSLALLLALGPSGQVQERLPKLVLLDEPDSRLDRCHTLALWRFLSGQAGPRQALLTSLDNHGALSEACGHAVSTLEMVKA
mmetsp:Transcript_68810/g.165173  ORF Transcript_68810/g.165173 Transcript_68810/m.165173 type:complete len:438 (-) Transcript_68810:48-1361(-)